MADCSASQSCNPKLSEVPEIPDLFGCKGEDCLLDLLGSDGERFEETEDVGEPEPDEPYPPLLDGTKDVILLSLHARSLRRRRFADVK